VCAVLAAAGASLSCSGSRTPTQPTSPPTDQFADPPRVSCPSPVTVTSRTGLATVATYDTPLGSGGQPPIVVNCTPTSGFTFPIGSTTVTCTATDARQRTATCSFPVVIAPPPRLSITRFLAFGDSLTAGEVVSEGSAGRVHALLIDDAKSYPTRLRESLNSRYSIQTISVINRGRSGIKAVDAPSDLSAFLALNQYDAVLLMHGANDLLQQDTVAMRAAADAMRQMVRDAKSRRVQVLLATLPPQNPNGCCPRRGVGAPLVVPYNDSLKLIAAGEGVPLVDVYQGFNGDVTTLIDFDGLHPTAAGYQRIADTFFDIIRARLEVPAPTTTLTPFSFPFPSAPRRP
jgi:lysophospholipase L1-like esterase